MSYNLIEGGYEAGQKKFAVVVSRFNDFITSKLLSGALDALMRHGAAEENITVVRVPGAFELPLPAQRLAASGKYDAVICLGATSHYDLVCQETAKGIAAASAKTGVPVIFGVVTSDTIEQAVERAGTKAGNKGFDAAMAALEMADVVSKL